MYLVQQIAPGAIAAMLVAAALCMAARWVGGGSREWLGAMPLGLGYACGHIIVRGWPGYPPADVTNWTLYFAIAAAPLGGISKSRISTRVRVSAAAIISAAVLLLLLKPKFQYTWSPVQGAVWVAVLAALTVLHWLFLDSAMRRRGTDGIEIPLFMLIPALGASIALLLSGSIVLGQLGIVLTTAVLGAMLTSSPGLPLGRGMAAAFAVIFSPLLISGYFYAELPAGCALLLWATAPLALIRRDTISARLIAVRIGVMLACIVAAVVLAFRASPPLDY